MSFDKFQKQDLTRPRDKAWDNWGKFDKEGDKVEGILRDAFFRKAEGQFPDKRGFTLEQEDGTLINIDIKRDPYFAIAPTDGVRVGDYLSMTLSELRDMGKGKYPAKIYSFETGVDPDAKDRMKQLTVKELEAADMQNQGVESEGEEKAEDVPFN